MANKEEPEKLYNPMNKEFQEEAKTLGLTGYQLIRKYQIEGKFIEKCKYRYGTGIYNDTNSCSRIKENGEICGEKFDKVKALRERDKDGNETGRWICNKCYMKDYDKKRDIKKEYRERYLSDRRTGNQNPNSTQAIGDLFERLTEIKKNVVNLNKKLDCYNTPIDHSADSEGRIPQTQGRLYNSKYGCWLGFGPLEREWNKKFDYMIYYCASEDGKIIERIYEIPKFETTGRTCISIYKNPMNTRGTGPIIPWYEKYRVKDEEEIKKINDIWKKIIK